MATEAAHMIAREQAEWALMWVILGVALSTIVMALVVSVALYAGVI